MKNIELASCYCFNPSCGKSIFEEDNNNIAVLHPLDKVLSGSVCCEECGAELISKPNLVMQKQILSAVLDPSTVEAILVRKEQISILI